MNSKPAVIIILALALMGAAGFVLAWHPITDPRGNKNIEALVGSRGGCQVGEEQQRHALALARSVPTRADAVMEHFDRRAVYAMRPFYDEP